jgi:DNA-binding CsgD family transcriptional regulator
VRDRPDVFRRVERAGSGCLIVGPAGIGKTTIARRAMEHLGRPFVTVHGFEGLATVPFAALNGVMTDAQPAETKHDADVVRRLRVWLSGLASAGTWVVVDDADLLDPPSSGLLSYTAQTEGLQLLATMRSDRELPADLDRLALHQSWPTIEMAAWTAEDIADALAATLGGPVAPELARHLFDLSAGVPLVVRELVMEGVENDAIHQRDGEWSGRPTVGSPESAARLIGRRLPTGGPALAVLQTVAIAGQVRPALLDRLASRDVLVELDAQSLLEFPTTTEEPFVRLAHPMIADALRSGLGEEQRREVLAAVVAAARGVEQQDDNDRVQLLHWALEIGEPLPSDELRDGYRLALGHFDYALAADIAGALNRQAPSAEAALFHAIALARANRFDEAVAIADEARDLATTDDEVIALARLLVRLHSPLGRTLGYLGGQPTVAEEVVAWADAHLGGSGFAHLLRSFSSFVEGELADAVDLAVLVVDEAAGAHRDLGIEADHFLLMIGPIAGRFDVARASRTRLAADGRPPLGLPTLMGSEGARVSMLMYDGRLREALAEDARLFAAAQRSLAYDEMMNAAAQMGMRNYLMGNIDASIASLELALQYRLARTSRSLLIESVLASAYARRGDFDRALDRLAQAEVERARYPAVLIHLDFDHLAASARAAAGQGEGSEAMIRASSDRASELGYPWLQANSRLSLVRLGAARAEDAHAAQAIIDAVDAPLIRAAAEIVVAAVAADIEELEAIAARCAAMDAHLFRFDALMAALACIGEDGDDVARGRVSRLLDATVADCPGLRRPAATAVAPSSLTAREREIAALAAEGLASKDIAERLGLSSRTVDNNLRRAYTKLGIKRRQELAEALRA